MRVDKKDSEVVATGLYHSKSLFDLESWGTVNIPYISRNVDRVLYYLILSLSFDIEKYDYIITIYGNTPDYVLS